MAGAATAGPTTQSTEEEELSFGQVWKEAGKAGGKAGTRPGLADGGRRKSSVQFHTTEAEETIRRESVSQAPRLSLVPKRMASPPPPSSYQRGVSFDTFDTRGATTESFTLRYKHRDYRASSRSRTFLCGTDAKDYSEYALEWMIDELVDDGDEIVCLRVIEKEVARELNLKHREEAQKLLDSVQRKNSTEEKAISMVMELAVGKVHEIFQQMVAIYEPSALVVGTRGRNLGGMQGLLPGSVSKYCLQHSAVPVIVVRPSSKRMKKKMKRRQETGKSLYASMVEQAQRVGGSHLYDKGAQKLVMSTEATKQESAAVAKAIGQPRRGILKASSMQPHAKSRATGSGSEEDEPLPSERFALPIGFLATEAAPRADLAMKSPSIAMLAEDWSDSTPPRARSPAVAPRRRPNAEASSAIDADDGEEDDVSLGVGKILDHRRPSTRETTPWLANILNEKPTRPPPGGYARSP
ncbi:hypothetical protein DV737_g21, partial [Chaetothyriales sp. CBS 132003]